MTDVERGVMKDWDERIQQQDKKLDNINLLLDEINEVG